MAKRPTSTIVHFRSVLTYLEISYLSMYTLHVHKILPFDYRFHSCRHALIALTDSTRDVQYIGMCITIE